MCGKIRWYTDDGDVTKVGQNAVTPELKQDLFIFYFWPELKILIEIEFFYFSLGPTMIKGYRVGMGYHFLIPSAFRLRGRGFESRYLN